jgi:hypothetical protein
MVVADHLGDAGQAQATRSRRDVGQLAPSSGPAMSMPGIARYLAAFTPVVIRARTAKVRPPSRCF